ncbi:MAG: phosphonate metabolism protein/1,5-bisphosphokinase (PRPP-forming) PhnN [Candidatus Thiodiazotropha sp. (ex Ctena orbiculata)]|nr:phosphonate metabolism protein/1,5-bisphosphokinase (PRPP-forming) PhnN [Candidatus Thiodiazotropha taylori]
MAELFYIIGASGVGKDSLINYLRQHLQPGAPVAIAHRYITRPFDANGENHIELSETEFANRMYWGCFALEWYSHRTWYGIGIEIDQWLSSGLSVVVNGSRAYLAEATHLYPDLIPVLITSDYDQLRQRLINRGRESAEQIEQRLETARLLDQQLRHPQLQRISNNGSIELAGEQLLKLVQKKESRTCA